MIQWTLVSDFGISMPGPERLNPWIVAMSFASDVSWLWCHKLHC